MLKLKIQSFLLLFLLIISVFASGNGENQNKIKTLAGKELDKTEVDNFIKQQMELYNIKGLSVAIINDGKIVYHTATGIKNIKTGEKVDNETTFEAASVSKSLFAWFVMKQVEKGLINLDTPLYKYLPYSDAAHDERYKLITARMVLSHRSGFPNWRWTDWNKDTKEFTLNIHFTPGSEFRYSGEGYVYLSKVIAHLNGLNLSNLDSLFQEEVAKPLGLKTAFFQQNKIRKENIAGGHKGDSLVYADYWDRNVFAGAGGLNSEAVSIADFLIAIMENRGLKTETYDEMLKENIKLKPDNELSTILGVDSWALGFALTHSDKGLIYSHAGNNLGYTSRFAIIKDKKYGYVFLTNGDSLNELYRKFEELLFSN